MQIDFSKIQLNDLDLHENLRWLVVKIDNVSHGKIIHTQPKLDRCCKSSGWDQDVSGLKFDS